MIACMSTKLKDAAVKELQSLPRETSDILQKELKKIPECGDGLPIGFAKRGKNGKKGNREPTEYQKYISVCMKGKNIHSFDDAPDAMRSCASEWRRMKGEKKRA